LSVIRADGFGVCECEDEDDATGAKAVALIPSRLRVCPRLDDDGRVLIIGMLAEVVVMSAVGRAFELCEDGAMIPRHSWSWKMEINLGLEGLPFVP